MQSSYGAPGRITSDSLTTEIDRFAKGLLVLGRENIQIFYPFGILISLIEISTLLFWRQSGITPLTFSGRYINGVRASLSK